MAQDLVRRLRVAPLEPRVRVPHKKPPEGVEPPRACFGGRPSFTDSSGGEAPKNPSTTIEWPGGDCDTNESRVFAPIGFTPTSLRDGECEQPIPLPEYNEIFRQYRIQRVKNPDDEDLWIDVEEALSSIFRGPDGGMVRFIWGQQPPASEIISEGSRGVPPPDITPPGAGD